MGTETLAILGMAASLYAAQSAEPDSAPKPPPLPEKPALAKKPTVLGQSRQAEDQLGLPKPGGGMGVGDSLLASTPRTGKTVLG